MAISFLQDIVVNNQITVGTSASASSGSRLDLFSSSIGFHSGGTDVGTIFNSGINFMINSGASGGIVYFGAPTTYTQNVDIQGGYLSVGNYVDIAGGLIKMDTPGTTTAVDVIQFHTISSPPSPYTSGKTFSIGDVSKGDTCEVINLMTMGNIYLQIGDDQIISSADELKFTGTLGSNPITSFWGLNSSGDVQKRTKAQFASDAGIVRTTTSQTIAGDKTFSGATTFTNSVTQTGGGTTTLSGDLDVQGSGISLVDDITFSGNGRIQGIDTVSASTDAANKAYVDAHPSGSMSSWTLTADSGGSETVTNGESVDIAGGTNIGTQRSGATVTITNQLTNNNQLTNGAGYTTNTGTTTASNSQTFTNKSGNISQWTNDSGYITSGSLPTVNNATITFTAGTGLTGGGTITLNQSSNETVTFNNSITNNNQLTNGAGYTTNTGTTTASNTQTFTNKSGNISQWTNDSGYLTSAGSMSYWNATADNGGTAQIDNAETVDFAGGTNINTARSGNTITINNEITNNTQLTNGAGYTTNTGTTTASNTQTFTNKSGNISQWTNDSGYITSSGAGMTNWNLTADSGGSTSITSNETVDFEGGTNISTSRSGNKITITNGITNNNQLTNGAGYTTNTGTTTASNTQTFTNKSGNISQWTNDAGYVTTTGSNNYVTGGNVTSGTVTLNRTGLSNVSFTINNSQITNGAGYTTNTGTTTPSNTQTFTNKSGNISQWTNDVGYVTSSGGSMSNWKITADNGGTATIDDAETVDIAGGTNINTARSGNTITVNNEITNNNQLTNGAGYTTNTGTVTSVATGNADTLTKSGTTAVTLTPKTAAVTNGGVNLATGDQIYDFVGGWQFSAGGGDVSGTAQLGQSVILTMATVNSNVGSFTNANITVDAKGRITAASSGSGGGVTGSGSINSVPKFTGSTAIGNSEIIDTGSTIQLGLDASNNSTLFLDTTNRKVGFRTNSPGAAFDVNGTIRVRNQLNVGDTTEQNLYVDGNANPGGKYVKMGNYGGATGNYFGITDAVNQPKYSAAFGSGGKIVQDKRIVTVKLTASALNSASGATGKVLIAAPGTNSIIWPTNIFIYRGVGAAGSGWATGTNVGASFYFCNTAACNLVNRKTLINIAGGVCGANQEWFWGRPTPLPSLNENPNVRWDSLKNKPLRFKTATTISSASMDWYVRIEYLKINVTAGFTNNVDTTVT